MGSSKAQAAARAGIATAPVRCYRAVLFLVALLIITAAFAVLTVLVKTTPSFPLDLHINTGLQSIHSPVFGGWMVAISWPGFWPQVKDLILIQHPRPAAALGQTALHRTQICCKGGLPEA